jgi:hypothetical protein
MPIECFAKGAKARIISQTAPSLKRLSTTMNDDIQRAIRHEAGHATAGLHLGFQVKSVSVKNGMPLTHLILDSPEKTPHERFLALAGGIASEQFFYGRYDPDACARDAAMISERGGVSIEAYLPEALGIMQSNKSKLRGLVGRLVCRMQEERDEAAFVAGANIQDLSPPSFEILSGEEILRIWRGTL